MTGTEYARKLADRVKRISDDRGRDSISPHLFFQLRPEHSAEFENVVLDPSVVMPALKGVNKRTIAELTAPKKEKLREVLGEEGFEEIHDPLTGGLNVKVRPEENIDYVAEMLEEGTDIYYPDHIENCLYGSLESLRDEGDSYARNFSELKEDVNKYLPKFASQIPVKHDFGLRHYRQSELEELEEHVTSKDLTEKACEKVSEFGETAVATYDSNLTNMVDHAYTPFTIVKMQQE